MYPENTIAQHEQARADAVPPKSSALLVRRFGALVCLAIICIFGAVLLYPHASSVYYLEAGGRALEKAKVFRAAHPHEPNPPLDRALRYFQRATEIDPTDGYAYRRLGQAWLLTGNNEAARDALGRADELRPNHPLIHIELGYAYDGLGQAGRALAEYEKGGYGPAAEAAIVNYLKVADWQASSGAGDYALEILEKVLVLEPDNLPALYRMMRSTIRMQYNRRYAKRRKSNDRIRFSNFHRVYIKSVNQ